MSSTHDSEVDDWLAQKKRKIDNPQVRSVRGGPQAFGGPKLEGSGCCSPSGGLDSYSVQDSFSGQDPFDEAVELLATVGDDEPTDGGPKEDGDGVSAPQSHENDTSHSSHMTRTLAAPAALAAPAPQELVAAIDVQLAILPATALVESASNDHKTTPKVAEMADNEQEWEICGIIDDKNVDGELQYLVQWTPTWVPASQTECAMALVAEYKKRKWMDEKERGRLRASKAGKQAIAGARPIDKGLKKRGRGRPRKHV